MPKNNIEKQAREAVKKIPQLVSEDKKSSQKKDKIILWTVVSFFTLMIMFMWGWNLLVSVQDIKTKEAKEENVFYEAKENFQKEWKDEMQKKTDVLNQIEEEQNTAEKETIKTNLKNSLIKIFTNQNNITSTTDNTDTEVKENIVIDETETKSNSTTTDAIFPNAKDSENNLSTNQITTKL